MLTCLPLMAKHAHTTRQNEIYHHHHLKCKNILNQLKLHLQFNFIIPDINIKIKVKQIYIYIPHNK